MTYRCRAAKKNGFTAFRARPKARAEGIPVGPERGRFLATGPMSVGRTG